MDRQWEIRVSVPLRLPGDRRDELFSAVVRAVEEWEPAPAERDEWDADVAGCPADEWPDLVELEASRRDWATEAVGLREKLERLESLALNTAALHSGMLVGIGGDHDPVPSDEQCQRAAGLIERAIRRGMGPGYVTQAELRLLAAIEAPQGLCACLTPEGAAQVAAQPKWTLPQCSVHPDRGGNDD